MAVTDTTTSASTAASGAAQQQVPDLSLSQAAAGPRHNPRDPDSPEMVAHLAKLRQLAHLPSSSPRPAGSEGGAMEVDSDGFRPPPAVERRLRRDEDNAAKAAVRLQICRVLWSTPERLARFRHRTGLPEPDVKKLMKNTRFHDLWSQYKKTPTTLLQARLANEAILIASERRHRPCRPAPAPSSQEAASGPAAPVRCSLPPSRPVRRIPILGGLLFVRFRRSLLPPPGFRRPPSLLRALSSLRTGSRSSPNCPLRNGRRESGEKRTPTSCG